MMPRGAKSFVAKAIDMDASQFNRKLKTDDPLNVSQARTIADVMDSFDPSQGPTQGAPPPSNRVAVYGYAAASNGDRVAMNPGGIIDWIDLPMGLTLRGEYFVVKTIGFSMEPRIFEGEMLVIQRHVPPIRDRDVLIEFHDGSGVIKTYRGQKNGRVYAFQYNPEEELSYDGASVKSILNVFCRL